MSEESLKLILNSKTYEVPFDQEFRLLNQLRESSEENKPIFEKQISQNLDNYLELQGNEIMRLPIQTLYNIFNERERKLDKHNLAYQLIIKHGKEHPEIFSLLEHLDGFKLSKSNLEDSILNQREHYGFHPNINFEYITSKFNEETKELQKFEEKLNNNETTIQRKFESMKAEIEAEMQKQIQEIQYRHSVEVRKLREIIETKSAEIKTIEEKCNDEKKTLEDKYEQKFMNIESEFQQKLESMKEEIQNHHSVEVRELIEIIKTKSAEIKSIEEKCNKKISEFEQRIQNETKQQINELKDKQVRETENIKKEIIREEVNQLKNELSNMKDLNEKHQNEQLQIIQQIQKQIPNITPKSLISQENNNQIFTIPFLAMISHDTQVYFKNLIIWICKDKPNVKFGTWIGAVGPNAKGWMILTIYDTSDINKEGLPSFCGGCYQSCSNSLVTFCTFGYVFSLKIH